MAPISRIYLAINRWSPKRLGQIFVINDASSWVKLVSIRLIPLKRRDTMGKGLLCQLTQRFSFFNCHPVSREKKAKTKNSKQWEKRLHWQINRVKREYRTNWKFYRETEGGQHITVSPNSKTLTLISYIQSLRNYMGIWNIHPYFPGIKSWRIYVLFHMFTD